MDLIQSSYWHGRSPLAEDDGETHDRPSKRLRTSRSHASILQPLSRTIRAPLETIGEIAASLGYPLQKPLSPEEEQKHLLLLRLSDAKTQEEWHSAAAELDRVEGGDVWKAEEESEEYDYELVRARLERLEKARRTGDLEEMHNHVRRALSRDLGDMGAVRLYTHSRIGTKALIERYIETVVEVVDVIADASGHGPSAEFDARHMVEQMKHTRQAFGRSALLLSGGGTFGMNHIGVVKCLFEAKLLPRIISGASAGSIVCSVLCTKTDEDMPQVLADFCYGDLAVFERDGGEDLLTKVKRLMTQGSIYEIDHLIRIMKEWLGDITFQESYNRTRRILNICISSADAKEMPKLLNYVTAPNVMIWSAVAASCAVPVIFRGAELMSKDPETGEQKPCDECPGKWIDGSVDHDLPMTRLSEMFNVNHFIVSQVNPHVVPFLTIEEDEFAPDLSRGWSALAPGPGWTHFMADWAKGEVIHRMHQAAELGIMPTLMTKCRSVLGQKYAGDITIVPEMQYAQILQVLANPTSDFMLQATLNGERATWPKLSRIRNRLAIELALDRAVHKLLDRVAFSPSQVDLRLGTFRTPNHMTRSYRTLPGDNGRARSGSTASTISPRATRGRHAHHRHRLVRSDLDPRTSASATHIPTPKVPGPELADSDSDSDTDDTGSARSRSHSRAPSSNAGEEEDAEHPFSDTTFDSPPSPEPGTWRAARTARRLFASASQLALPGPAQRRFMFRSSSSRAKTPPPPPPLSAALSMTPTVPAAAPNLAEVRYRGLFKPLARRHGQGGKSEDEAPAGGKLGISSLRRRRLSPSDKQ